MGRNIENESKIVTNKIIKDQEVLIGEKNKRTLDDSGMISLMTGLNDIVSDLDLNKENPVISSFRPAEDWESATLIYMWGDLDIPDEKALKSLTLITSIIDENKIHLLFREVKQNGEKKIEKSVVNVSDQDKKKEMLEIITSKFSTSLISYQKV